MGESSLVKWGHSEITSQLKWKIQVYSDTNKFICNYCGAAATFWAMQIRLCIQRDLIHLKLNSMLDKIIKNQNFFFMTYSRVHWVNLWEAPTFHLNTSLFLTKKRASLNTLSRAKDQHLRTSSYSVEKKRNQTIEMGRALGYFGLLLFIFKF